jgi:hypothetical protein
MNSSIFASEDNSNLYQDTVLYDLIIENQVFGYGLLNMDAEYDVVRGLYVKAWFKPYNCKSRCLETLEAIGRIYISSSSTMFEVLCNSDK